MAIRRSSRLLDRMRALERRATPRLFNTSTAMREVSEDEMIDESAGRGGGELRRRNRGAFPGFFPGRW